MNNINNNNNDLMNNIMPDVVEGDDEEEIGFFEGTEKLLEMWFTRKDGDVTPCDLRDIPRKRLDSVLKLVKCEVISFSQNDDIDAYVLSESSMFVAKRRFLLKTCGTTTLLACIEPLLYLVQAYTNFDEVEDIFYSRKNFMRPELQKEPHSSFEEETLLLNKLFPKGGAYCLGRMNHDCWYLYTTNAMGCSRAVLQEDPDQTLEIIMTELDPNVMKIFTKDECATAEEATKRSGIDKLLPDVYIDDYIFDPCGYSMNGIMKDGCYMTIHITPEPNCSYVSFETNCPLTSYRELITRILATFRPGNFIVTLFANKESVAIDGHKDVQNAIWYSDFRRQDVQFCKFKNYDLTYAHFTKFPS